MNKAIGLMNKAEEKQRKAKELLNKAEKS